MIKRDDNYVERRAHLANKSDEQLWNYFWELAEKIVDPLLKLGYENTSPSIERSVLLRMGFSSVEVKPIIEEAIQNNLLAHGAGNIVYKVAQHKKLSIREAGLKLSRGELWEDAAALFKEVQ
ncbi:MAG: ornithine aminomutase subunit alpha [Lachnospiraceae bacterium]